MQLALVPPPETKAIAKPPGQKRFAQGAAKAFEAFPKFTQVKGPGPQKLALPEPEKDAGKISCWRTLFALWCM